jgi:hypothetical protein
VGNWVCRTALLYILLRDGRSGLTLGIVTGTGSVDRWIGSTVWLVRRFSRAGREVRPTGRSASRGGVATLGT